MKILKIGIFGTIVSALCCFTPLLVFILGAFGFGAFVGTLDYILLPVLFFFIGLTMYAYFHKG
ncbi:MAG: mercury resistance system transport protein MerF [SAR324 cluster bacterium]|nr:mercury resistance system transport protein MerF [SAR324 cluster bacterium]